MHPPPPAPRAWLWAQGQWVAGIEPIRGTGSGVPAPAPWDMAFSGASQALEG